MTLTEEDFSFFNCFPKNPEGERFFILVIPKRLIKTWTTTRFGHDILGLRLYAAFEVRILYFEALALDILFM